MQGVIPNDLIYGKGADWVGQGGTCTSGCNLVQTGTGYYELGGYWNYWAWVDDVGQGNGQSQTIPNFPVSVGDEIYGEAHSTFVY